jgi:hypothetical protein
MSPIRDRGTKKWTSIMLPEHIKMLRNYANDEYYQVQKPTLDEQKIEELNEVICEAMEFNNKLHFTYYKNGHHVGIDGHIHHICIERKLHIVDSNNEALKINVEDIINVEFR